MERTEHIEPVHLHEHEASHEQAFPADEENLLLDIAREVAEGDHVFDMALPSVQKLDELRDHYNTEAIQARIGDVFPQLANFTQQAVVLAAFADRYETLPKTHSRYEHGHEEGNHAHDHEHHDCGRIHGPVKRWMERIEQKALGKIKNHTAKRLAKHAIDLWALTLCPGDDLAAIGLQMYGAVSGHMDSHNHQEHKAILPRRSRIDFEHGTATISLPLDVRVSHNDLSRTPEGEVIRSYIEDVPPPPKKRPEAVLEKMKRRFRRVALGMAALTLTGVAVSGSHLQEEAPEQPRTEVSAPIEQPVPLPDKTIPQPEYAVFENMQVKKGDSMWELAGQKVEEAYGEENAQLTDAVTDYMAQANRKTHPNPDHIVPGDRLHIPSTSVIRKYSIIGVWPEQ